MIIVVIETCHYNECEWNGELLESQGIIRNMWGKSFHIKCFLAYINELHNERVAREEQERRK